MISPTATVSAADLKEQAGWDLKPEGLCRGDVCLPFESTSGQVDLADLAARLDAALVHDPAHGLWSLGPSAPRGGRFLADSQFPDLTLPDLEGQPFSFSSLLGRKVVMVAWASW